MKKFFIVLIAALSLSVAANAQSRAIGVRATYGGEISYQHTLGSNFAELDLGWFYNGIYLSGLYDFTVWQQDACGIYVGAGATLGLISLEQTSRLEAGISGQVGFEWRIPSVPINISLDWRPTFFLTGQGFAGQGAAIGLRYRF